MAELDAQLRLDIDQALRDVDRLQGALDRAIAPIEIEVDDRQALELEDTLREVERIAGRAATETASIDLAAGRAEANFEDMARSLGIGEAAARDLTNEILQAQAASNRVEDATRDVARQLGLSETEARRFVDQLQRADRAADAINITTGLLPPRFDSIRTAIAGVASALAAIGGAQLLAGAVRGANSAVQAYAGLVDSVNAVRVVFREGADSALAFGEQAAQSAGLSAFAFNQSVAPIGAVLTNFGFGAREAADAAVILVQRGADLASVYGGTVQDAVLAITSALVGQVEPLRRFGGEISQARVEAFALAEGMLQAGEEMDTATAVQARYGLILKDTAAVQDDFVNTSGDLANAQRILAAETENLISDIGGQLAPAFEAILQQAPTILNFFGSLAVALGETATSATEAGAPLSDLARNLSAVTLGLGSIPDIAGGLGDVAQGFVGLLDDVINLDPAFTNLNAQMDDFNQRVAQEFIRIASQQITDALATGTDAATGFANSIAFLGRQDNGLRTVQQSYARLATAAGLSGRSLLDVTRFLIDNADAADLNAEELVFLRNELALLTNSLDPNIEALRQQRFELAQMPDVVAPYVSALEGIQIAASEVGVSLADIVTGIDPVAQALGETLTPAQNTALAFLAINTESGAAAAILQERLRPALADVSGALTDLNKNGKLSVAEFIANMEAMTEAALAFRADFANVAIISPELAANIATLPDDVRNDLLAKFRANPAAILEAEEALLGTPAAIAASFRDTVGAALDLVRQTGPNDEARTTLLAQLTASGDFSPGELTALTQILNGALDVSMADVQPPSFTPVFVRSFEDLNQAQITASMNAALGASHADLELPTITPAMLRSIQGMDSAAIARAVQTATSGPVDSALNASFADVELPPFTPIITDSIASANTAEVTAEMNAVLDVSFADVTLPDPTDQVAEAYGKIDPKEVTTALDAALGVSFADIDLSDEGAKAAATYWDGFAAYAPGAIPVVRGSITKTLSNATNAHSPPKLFLDAGIEAGETYWAGFEQADLSPDALITAVGQLSAVGKAAAGSFRTSFEQLEGELPAVIQRSAEAVNLTHFDDLGAAIAQQLTTAVEGDFRLSPELDPLTAEQLLALNLDPITPVIGPADPLTVGQLQEMVDAANAARTVVESQLEAIQFDFELQGYQEQFAALTATTGEVGIAAREAFMVGLSASTSEEVVQLRASILDAINSATESSSPSRLMLRLGGDAGDAYWSGFEQADMQLKVPIPTMTGKISTSTAAAAAGEGAGFTFAPTYVNTETRDLETVVARSEQLMGAVSGILNGRFKL